MPTRARSAGQFQLLLSVSLLTAIAQGAWLTTMAVFLAERYPASIVPAMASGATGLSYLLSVLLASWGGLRYLRVGVVLLALGLLLVSRVVWLGALLTILGSGWLRPVFITMVRDARPQEISAGRAFSIFTVLINVGWVIGSLAADAVRFSLGWSWLYVSMALLPMVALGLSGRIQQPAAAADEQRATKSAPLAAALFGLLPAVVCFYLVSAQAQSVLPLLAEAETIPLHIGAHSVAMTAGLLAATHGGAVLLIALCLSVRQVSIGAVSLLVGGLLLLCTSLVLLAVAKYPVASSWVYLAVLVLSVGESFAAPSMMALGSKLVGLGRNAYWLAATAGYAGSALLGTAWPRWTHAGYFGLLAAFCVIVAVLVVASTQEGSDQ